MNLLPSGAVRPVEWSAETTFSNVLQLAESYRPVTYGSRTVEQVLTAGAVIWIGAAALLLAGFTALYITARLRLRRAWSLGVRPLEKGVYLWQAVPSPMAVGIVRPKILLPPACPPRTGTGCCAMNGCISGGETTYFACWGWPRCACIGSIPLSGGFSAGFRRIWSWPATPGF